MVNLTIIGGGILGIAAALEIIQTFPGIAVQILEKESAPATHQTGRNSGVIHAGIYYKPGSLKAIFCKAGRQATIRFCKEYGVPFRLPGKLLVATDETETWNLERLHQRALENGLNVRKISKSELQELEPNVRGRAALLSPDTGIVDYSLVCEKMIEVFKSKGGEIHYHAKAVKFYEKSDAIEIVLSDGREFKTRYLIACAGIAADRLAASFGVASDFAIIPFKGEYYRLAPRHDQIVTHLIYPVPDPSLPFLGIHLTRMMGGYVAVGPNAVLSFAREKYSRLAWDKKDVLEMIRFPGFWKVLGANLRTGLSEMANSFLKKRYLQACQRYCPSLTLEDLNPHPAGIRAQAVMQDGALVHDFLIRETERSIHVCNAPSPAATSAIPIARHICKTAKQKFML